MASEGPLNPVQATLSIALPCEASAANPSVTHTTFARAAAGTLCGQRGFET
jgi:hypothetical protein